MKILTYIDQDAPAHLAWQAYDDDDPEMGNGMGATEAEAISNLRWHIDEDYWNERAEICLLEDAASCTSVPIQS